MYLAAIARRPTRNRQLEARPFPNWGPGNNRRPPSRPFYSAMFGRKTSRGEPSRSACLPEITPRLRPDLSASGKTASLPDSIERIACPVSVYGRHLYVVSVSHLCHIMLCYTSLHYSHAPRPRRIILLLLFRGGLWVWRLATDDLALANRWRDSSRSNHSGSSCPVHRKRARPDPRSRQPPRSEATHHR